MNYQLLPLDQQGEVQPIALLRPVLLIGRHVDCDHRINLPKISRRHCCLALAYDRVVIRDLGSRNGLRVNGELVQEARLKSGDEVAIGPLIYRLVAERPAAEQPTRGHAASSGAGPGPAPRHTAGPRSTPVRPDPRTNSKLPSLIDDTI